MPIISYTQLHIVGNVFADTAKETPIANAVVQCKSVPSNNIIAYARTNEYGFFILKLSKNLRAYTIECRAPGYLLQKKTFHDSSTQSPLVIHLQKIAYSDIVIRSSSINLHANDTTRFLTKEFKTGTELNIQELLQKLPNVQILDNGTIFFKNKPVGNVLIEGDDMLGAGYTKYTKNFGNTGIAQFEFIENYVDSIDRIIGTPTKKTVLNIVYKNAKRVFSTNNIAVDIKGKNAIINTDFLRLGKRIKNLGYANANNIGLTGSLSNNMYDFFDDPDIATTYKPTFDQQNYFPITLITKTGIAQERLNANKSIHGNLSFLVKTKNKSVFRTNITSFADNNVQVYNSTIQFNEPQFIKYYQNNRNTLKEKYIAVEALYVSPKQKKWVIVAKPHINFLQKNDVTKGFFQMNASNQSFNATKFRVENLLSFSKRVNNAKRNVYNLFVIYEKTPDTYSYNSVDAVSNFLLLPNKPILQQKTLERMGMAFNKSIDGNLKRWQFKTNVTVKGQAEQWKRALGVLSNNVSIVEDSSIISSKLNIVSVQMNQYINRTFKYVNELTIGNNTALNYIVATHNRKAFFALFPFASFNKAFNTRTHISFNVRRYFSPPNLQHVNNNYWVSSLNVLRIGTTNVNYTTGYNIGASYANDFNKKITTSYFINHSIEKPAYVTAYRPNNNFQVIKELFNSKYNRNTSFYAYVSFYNRQGLHLFFDVNASLSSQHYNTVEQLLKSRNLFNAYKLIFIYNKPKIFYSKLTMVYGTFYNASNIAVSTKLIKNQYTISAKQYVSFSIHKRYSIEFKNDLLYVGIANQSLQSISLFDVGYKMPIGKKESVLGIEARNLFNATTFAEYMVFNNNSTTTNFNLFSRLVMISYRKVF